MTRKNIREIALDISKDWTNISPTAKPYLDAMLQMDRMNDGYYLDSGRSIIAYFLSNATTWRGEKAREIKKELNKLIK